MITSISDAVRATCPKQAVDAFLFSIFVFACFGKVAGACLFGKCADKLSFFTVMQLVTAFSLCRAIQLLIIVIFGKDFYVFYKCFYIIKLLSTFLLYATIILPAMYLFDRYASSKHILIGTYIMLAFLAGNFFLVLWSIVCR
ncbi:MAG: hypothetical protein WCJ92_05535 [Alphaproteobacteria bacterium]